MAKTHCLVIVRPGESPDFFRARIEMAVTTVARTNGLGGRSVGAASATPFGLRLDPRWTREADPLPSEVCYIASYDRTEAAQAFMQYDMERAMDVPRNHVASRLLFDFRTIFSKHRDRNGMECELVGLVERPSLEVGYDMLPMLRLRFADGLEITAFPEEAVTANVACAAAKAKLLEQARHRLDMLMEAA